LVHRFRAEIGGKPAEVFGEVHDVVDAGDDTFEEGKIDLNLGTGAKPVHEFGVSGAESVLVFEDYPGSRKWVKLTKMKSHKHPLSLFPPSLLMKH